jgi:hypothetical protein
MKSTSCRSVLGNIHIQKIKVKVSIFFSNIEISTFYFSKSSTALFPIRCLLYIMHMQWRSKRLQSRGSSFRNGSESEGQFLECTGRGRKTNKKASNLLVT